MALAGENTTMNSSEENIAGSLSEMQSLPEIPKEDNMKENIAGSLAKMQSLPEIPEEGNVKENIAGSLPEIESLPEIPEEDNVKENIAGSLAKMQSLPEIPEEDNVKENIAGSLPEIESLPEIPEEDNVKENIAGSLAKMQSLPEIPEEDNVKENIAGSLPEIESLPEIPEEDNVKKNIAGSLPEIESLPEISEEGNVKQCPLCQSTVQNFYLNMEDKVLLCENTDCMYPFGFTEMMSIQPGEDAFNDETTQSRDNSGDNNASVSERKLAELMAEINKLRNSMSEQSPEPCPNPHKKQKITATETSVNEEEDELLKSIQEIKELHQQLSSLNNELEQNQKEEEGEIKNETRNKNLKSFQEKSGVQLLKPDEMGLLKKEPVIGSGELKIEIDPGNVSNNPSIRIEIHNDSEKEKKVGVDDETPIVPDKPEGEDPLPD